MGVARQEGVVGPPGTPPPDAMWGQRRLGPVCHWATRCRRVDAVGGQGRLLIMDWRLLQERETGGWGWPAPAVN
jgi:hypothetical protein